jgi:hypothetical protein
MLILIKDIEYVTRKKNVKLSWCIQLFIKGFSQVSSKHAPHRMTFFTNQNKNMDVYPNS